MSELNRREFLEASAIAAGVAATPGVVAAQTSAPESSWYGRPMRWVQLAFVEDDPGQYDPAFWLEYFRRVHADAACLSAGGCVAFYPTRIPLHYRSKFLGNTDPFGDMVAGCRKLGMNVVARTDPHAAHQDVYDAHPDWIAVDASGKKRKHWADPDFWVTCALGPYNFEFMTEVTKEIVRDYKVDGVFSNRWAGSGMCYCEHCRENFHKFSGLDLPRTLDPHDPSRRQYILWKQARLFELWRLWDSEIKKLNPNASYIANAGGGALSELDMKTIGELAPTLFADRQARHGLMPPWANGKNGKEYAATLGGKAIAGITSVGLEEAYRWKDSVQSSDEIRLWFADGTAHNLRPWCTKFNAKPIDRRWLPVVEEYFNWHYRNEKYLRNEKSLAEVAMVYSQQTAAFYGGEHAQARVEDYALGAYQAMVEGRIPFDMVHDKLLDPEHVDRYRVLILPNLAALSDAQCKQITEYVHRGGSIVATYETSLYDEWGNRRANFGLSEIFGASFTGTVDTGMHNSYLNIEGDHPLVHGLENATRIINGVNQVRARAVDAAGSPPLTLVPEYPDLPMEEVYTRVPRTKIPGVYIREFGRGRVVYFPFDLDRTFWDVLATDHGTLLRNAITWAHGAEQPLTVAGKGVIDVSVWTQEKSMTAHLVNLTNPMMMKGPVRELIPSPAQRVRIRVPKDRRVTAVHLLVHNQTPKFRITSGVLELDVPPIELHEVVALDLA